MLRGLFVTGTDTGVGKTVVSAALLHRYGALVPLRYWKPVQTGIEMDDDTRTVRELCEGSGAGIFDRGARLALPLSPHLSAARAGTAIDVAGLARPAEEAGGEGSWIVEGAGGVLVPLNEKENMADLMARLALPVVVVARSGLGTINHTLLTLEALRVRALRTVAVILVGEPDADNRAAIERFGAVPVVGEMPRFPMLESRALANWSRSRLDPDGALEEHLQ